MSDLNASRLEYLAGRIDRLLRPESFPVAVKLYKDKEELKEVKEKDGRAVRLVEGKNLAACQLIGQARYLGRVIGGTGETASMCMYGSWVLGFEELPVEYMHGYVRSYFINEEVAERNFATTPRFDVGSYSGILVAPLEKMPVEPDVVVVFGNTAQVYRLIHAYNYNKGVRMEFSSNGEAGACADLIALPVLTQKPSIALPCNGARMLSWPSDDGMAFALPAAGLEDIVAGLEFTHAGMIRYPLTWVHLDWEVQGRIKNVIRGKGFYSKEQRGA
ncbi:MAG: DUF169 domain-containing protein [Eubacteriales bacterium]